MMDPKDHLTLLEEKERYDQHNNDVNDPGYQEFVRPLVDAVVSAYRPHAAGLDYGAGSGPVAAHLLERQGYRINLYDPFYWPDLEALSRKYEYIIASEVIEHFRSPFGEFAMLRSLLLPGGAIFCMTELMSDEEKFADWYYKNDPTHVFFYHHKSLEWIRAEFGFVKLDISGRLVIFQL